MNLPTLTITFPPFVSVYLYTAQQPAPGQAPARSNQQRNAAQDRFQQMLGQAPLGRGGAAARSGDQAPQQDRPAALTDAWGQQGQATQAERLIRGCVILVELCIDDVTFDTSRLRCPLWRLGGNLSQTADLSIPLRFRSPATPNYSPAIL
jgi:hypothetical protein